jgi:hypothetical protein
MFTEDRNMAAPSRDLRIAPMPPASSSIATGGSEAVFLPKSRSLPSFHDFSISASFIVQLNIIVFPTVGHGHHACSASIDYGVMAARVLSSSNASASWDAIERDRPVVLLLRLSLSSLPLPIFHLCVLICQVLFSRD